MKIPKEIADKVEIYKAGNKAFGEVVVWLRENTDADGVVTADPPLPAGAGRNTQHPHRGATEYEDLVSTSPKGIANKLKNKGEKQHD